MVVAFPCKIGAPVTGITLSTRVGRLSGTHSDTGFQLNSISPMGRKVMELHGGESERLVGVSTSCWSVCRTIDRRGSAARQRGCKKRFGGRYHARTMKTNQKKIGVTACNQGRYTDWRPNLLHGMSTAVFVGSRTVDSLLPPACEEKCWKTLCPGVDTHTHTPTRTRTRARAHAHTHRFRAHRPSRESLA